jgi:hypothetical protein
MLLLAFQPTDHQLQTCLGDLKKTKENTLLLEPHLAIKKKKKQKSETLNP